MSGFGVQGDRRVASAARNIGRWILQVSSAGFKAQAFQGVNFIGGVSGSGSLFRPFLKMIIVNPYYGFIITEMQKMYLTRTQGFSGAATFWDFRDCTG